MSSPTASPNGTANSADKDAADRAPTSDQPHPADLDETWAAILSRLAELREYALYYVAANLDRLRLTARGAVMGTVLAIFVGLIAATIVATAAVLFVVSISAGLSELMGHRAWLGQLIVSVFILVSASGGAWLVVRRALRKYERTLVEKYEHRKQAERIEYGTDVEQRAKQRPRN
jgi:hypothetical protein